MPTQVIDVRSADDRRDVIHRAVQALAEGQIVAFPTETVYGLAVSALNADAVQKLLIAKGRPENQPLALAIQHSDQLWDYVPQASKLSARLARRCWPGPVTLVLPCAGQNSVVENFAPSVIQAVAPTGMVGLRIPAHDLITEVMRFLPGPLALTSANLSGEPDVVEGSQVAESLGDAVQLVLDDGKCRYAQSSTVVKVQENQLTILREGVVSKKVLSRLSSFNILFVCTGNTCRSPMAELLMQKQIANHLGCEIDHLIDRGVVVSSAGIAAYPGGRPSVEAVSVLSERGLDLSQHASQPIGDRLIEHADLILTMTRGHIEAIVSHWPQASDRITNLCLDGFDVADPFGGAKEVYEQCADQIESEIAARIKQLDFDSLLPKL
ncbi:MAG: threonylcarbamoyl-AMP synthase [Blastopirellula sp.]|nr:MAG: threonylcarbamoyl-AMP synthase [Blastopirellula sp.]